MRGEGADAMGRDVVGEVDRALRRGVGADDEDAAEQLRPYLGEYTRPRWYLACTACPTLAQDDGAQDQSAFLQAAWAQGWRSPHSGVLWCPWCVAAHGEQGSAVD